MNQIPECPEHTCIDRDRLNRCGFDEVILAGTKSPAFAAQAFAQLYSHHGRALATRCTPAHAKAIQDCVEKAVYDEISGCCHINSRLPIAFDIDNQRKTGPDNPADFRVAVIGAGTSDLPAAREASFTLSFFGVTNRIIIDVGVAGIHRLMSRLKELDKAELIIALAGMEGALPSVIGGLVSVPVIAVPVSAGYGVSAGGFTALFSMLSSCANGITVVNIDNGYGAAIAALRIIRTTDKNGGMT